MPILPPPTSMPTLGPNVNNTLYAIKNGPDNVKKLTDIIMGYDNPGVVEIKDNSVGIDMLDKLSRLNDDRRIDPLSQFDNISYPHRYLYDTHNLLIGDTYFMIPPEFIAVTSDSTHQTIVTLRQENTQKMKSGYHKRMVMIDLVFNGTEQLNGYKVDGPEGVYYVDGLRQLLAQFKCTPFLPISNSLINGMYGIFTVALQSITIRTMPGFPDTIQAHITLQEVNMFPYLQMPDIAFKYMIDWDLFRFYYQRLLTETHEYKKLQSLPANKEHNKFKISILDESVFSSGDATKYNMLEIVRDEKIVKTKEDGVTLDTTNYTTWIDSDVDNINISSFQCNYSNILTNVQLSDAGSPTVQFMGGMDTIYNITFETTSYETVQALEQCQITNDILTRSNRKLYSLGFVKLTSELVEFTGSQFVMIESVSTNTVPGFPGLFNVQIQCVAYDIAQSERENLNGFMPFDCNEEGKCGEYENAEYDKDGNVTKEGGYVSDHVHDEQAIDQSMEGLLVKTKQDAYAENRLRKNIEVYPDLRLPTYSEVDAVIKKIRKFREKHKLSQLKYTTYPKSPTYMMHGLSLDNNITFEFANKSKSIIDITSIDNYTNQYDIFVDPDFYVFYPTSYASFNENNEDCYSAYSPKKRSSRTKVKSGVSSSSYNKFNDNILDTFCNLALELASNSRSKYVRAGIGKMDSDGKYQFDCIGFVVYLLKFVGLLPAHQEWMSMPEVRNLSFIKEVDMSEAQRGDILYEMSENKPAHAMVYLGDNGDKSIAHASGRTAGVKTGKHYLTSSNGICLRVIPFEQCASRTPSINSSLNGGAASSVVASVGNAVASVNGLSSYNSVEEIIHQDLGVWTPITPEEMNAWIDEWKPNGCRFTGQGAVFVEAGYITGLDPRYIMAHAAHESGWGTSDISIDKNNFFGINAVDWAPYDNASSFDGGFSEGIIEGAKWIARNYYNNSNYSQKTLYTMRNNNGQHQYATDKEWHTKIANIMVGAPNNTSGKDIVLSMTEFESICRIIMAKTQGEDEKSEKAMAQLIYDRLTYPDEETFGDLSTILNNTVMFPSAWQDELNDTIENSVRSVFCNNDKPWPGCQVLYCVPISYSPGDRREYKKYDSFGDVGTYSYYGFKSTTQGVAASDARFLIISNNSASYASTSKASSTSTVNHELITISSDEKFGQPVYIKTDAISYNGQWEPWANTEEEIARKELNSTENLFNTSFCDEVQYSGRGKLVRAFPAYLFCILDDQAQWYNGCKLWTNYYVYKSIVDIAVHSTNDMPVETATITITNSHHNLSNMQGGVYSYKLSEDDGYNKFQQWWYSWSGTMLGFGPKLTDKLIKLHQVIYNQALLREGARVHIRMGYGSDPLSLAPVMNGHISDISLGDQITIVAVSDGQELVQQMVSSDKKDTNNGWFGIFGLGENQESSNIIADTMCKRSSWVTHLAGDTFEASKYGIEHYGLYLNKTLFKMKKYDDVAETEEEMSDTEILTAVAKALEDEELSDEQIEEICTEVMAMLEEEGLTTEEIYNELLSILTSVLENEGKTEEEIKSIYNEIINPTEDSKENTSTAKTILTFLFTQSATHAITTLFPFLAPLVVGNNIYNALDSFADKFKTPEEIEAEKKEEEQKKKNIIKNILSFMISNSVGLIFDLFPNNPIFSALSTVIKSSVGTLLNGVLDPYIENGISIIDNPGMLEDTFTDIWDGHQENYDLLKNIYKANYRREHYIYTTSELIGTQRNEKNVVFNRFNMTPWDVFQVCTQQVPEYIIKSSYHQFDSRLYFGLPFWMEKYRYDYLNKVVYEECKSAAQVHFIDSMDCIIDNQVKVTSRFSNTNVKVLYTKGSELTSTDIIHSDDSIDASKQKTSIIDTVITQDALGPDAIYEVIGYSVGEESARRVGISNLLYGWQQQYQGQIILMGHPGLKPHDYIMLNDTFANLFGLCFAREVTHSFNAFTGFTTSVVPGMISFSTDENSGLIQVSQNYLMLLNCFSSYTQIRKNLRNNYEKNITLISKLENAQNELQIAANKLEKLVDSQELYDLFSDSFNTIGGIGDIIAAYKTTKFVFDVIQELNDYEHFADLVKGLKKAFNIADDVKDFIKIAKAVGTSIKGFKAALTTFKSVKAAIATFKAATIGTGTFAGGWPGVVAAAIWVVVDILLDELFEWLSNRNVCTLLPLWWEGYPFVAGVKDGEKILLTSSNAVGTDENNQQDGVPRDSDE